MIVSIILALLISLFGYRLHKVGVTVAGFCLGYLLSMNILSTFFQSDILVFIISVLIGVCIAFSAYNLYLLGVFILCFLLTYIICTNNIPFENSNLIGIMGGLIVGCLGISFNEIVIILVTSIAGSSYIAMTLIPNYNVIVTIVLSIITVLFQFYLAGFSKKGE